MEEIQLAYKSQLTPLILLLPLVQIPPTPFLVISDLTSFFNLGIKRPQFKGF
ncbi:hypothetical protein ckin8_04060 [Helicobacter pylori]